MNTGIKKLISTRALFVLALVLLLVFGIVLEVNAKKSAPSLTGTLDYVFVGHLGVFDAEGRLLVWEGTISGDVEGVILYWLYLGGGPPNMPEQAPAFYETRWEIWDGSDLLLAGESAGRTAAPSAKDVKDGIWHGTGIVTEASEEFEDWIGRQVYETGNVNWAFPWSGSGVFRIN